MIEKQKYKEKLETILGKELDQMEISYDIDLNSDIKIILAILSGKKVLNKYEYNSLEKFFDHIKNYKERTFDLVIISGNKCSYFELTLQDGFISTVREGYKVLADRLNKLFLNHILEKGKFVVVPKTGYKPLFISNLLEDIFLFLETHRDSKLYYKGEKGFYLVELPDRIEDIGKFNLNLIDIYLSEGGKVQIGDKEFNSLDELKDYLKNVKEDKLKVSIFYEGSIFEEILEKQKIEIKSIFNEDQEEIKKLEEIIMELAKKVKEKLGNYSYLINPFHAFIAEEYGYNAFLPIFNIFGDSLEDLLKNEEVEQRFKGGNNKFDLTVGFKIEEFWYNIRYSTNLNNPEEPLNYLVRGIQSFLESKYVKIGEKEIENFINSKYQIFCLDDLEYYNQKEFKELLKDMKPEETVKILIKFGGTVFYVMLNPQIIQDSNQINEIKDIFNGREGFLKGKLVEYITK